MILFVLYSDCNCQHEPFEHLAKIDRLLLRKYLLFKVFMLNVFFDLYNQPNNFVDYRFFINFG